MKCITFDDHKKCLFENKVVFAKFNILRAREHTVTTDRVTKVALSAKDDKRVIIQDYKTLAINFIERGYKNNRLYIRMREVGVEGWEILPLLSRTCGKKEVYELEKKWIRVLKADLNMTSPIREEATRKEYQTNYREANKEAKKLYDANRYKANKKAIRQKQADYYEANKDYRAANIQNKVYHCDTCEMSFGTSGKLKRHLNTFKHSYAWINAVD